MGGGAPDAKPKESAGAPKGDKGGGPASTAAGAPPAPGSPGTTGPMGGGGDSPDTSGPRAMVGTPDVGPGTPSGKTFVLKNGAVIQTQVFTKNGQTLIGFTAPGAIDGDGPTASKAADSTSQKQTSLRYTPGGESINAQVVPFIVISKDFPAKHPEVSLGDYASVTYGGKTLYGIVADVGPALGEVSQAMARGIGINSDPVRGGVESSSLLYLIAPGSGKKFPIPRKSSDAQTNGATAFGPAVLR